MKDWKYEHAVSSELALPSSPLNSKWKYYLKLQKLRSLKSED